MLRHAQVRVLRHEVNQGKGAALHTGFKQATGDFVAIQDADLEYDPHDLKRLLEPLTANLADVVIGSLVQRTPRPLLLALGWEPIPHTALEYVHRPQPHGHRDLL